MPQIAAYAEIANLKPAKGLKPAFILDTSHALIVCRGQLECEAH